MILVSESNVGHQQSFDTGVMQGANRSGYGTGSNGTSVGRHLSNGQADSILH